MKPCLVRVATVADRIENITTDAEMPRRFDTRSKLTIRAQPNDNDAEYTCEARHPALIAPKRASVALNIQCKDLLSILSFMPSFFFILVSEGKDVLVF